MTRKARNEDRRITKRGRAGIFIAIAVIGAIVLCFVASNAYEAEINYKINSLNQEIQQTERTIQNLEVKIKSASNITTLENRAFELGLVYPGFDQIVYLGGETQIDNLALALMESVYE